MTLSTAEPHTFDARSETKQATDRDAAGELPADPRPDCYRAKPPPQSIPRQHAGANWRTEATLEYVVCETLRPVLKSWLDENLPSLVERDGAGGNRAGRPRALIARRARANRGDFAAWRSRSPRRSRADSAFFVRDLIGGPAKGPRRFGDSSTSEAAAPAGVATHQGPCAGARRGHFHSGHGRAMATNRKPAAGS